MASLDSRKVVETMVKAARVCALNVSIAKQGLSKCSGCVKQQPETPQNGSQITDISTIVIVIAIIILLLLLLLLLLLNLFYYY
jgi:hypothetical protein